MSLSTRLVQAMRSATSRAASRQQTCRKRISPATLMRKQQQQQQSQGSSFQQQSKATSKATSKVTTFKKGSKATATKGKPDLRYHAAKFPPKEIFSRPPMPAATSAATAAGLGSSSAASFASAQQQARRALHTSAAALRRSRKTMQSAETAPVIEETGNSKSDASGGSSSAASAKDDKASTKNTLFKALDGKKISFVGSGKMAEAIMGGMISCGAVEASQITACDPNASRRSYLKDKYHVLTTANNASVAKASDILILAVKPQTMGHVLENLRPSINKNCLVVSIAAGFTLSQIQEGLGTDTVVRAMPNTPALINESITSWIFTEQTTPDQRRQAKALLNAFGDEVLLYDERQLDMATALSGSGPAMCQLMFEAMIDAGVHMGFPRETSRKLVLHTVRGAANLALHSGEHPSMLKNDITSPGGTTAAALYQLEKGATRTVFSDAVWAAYRRARELGGLDSCVGPGRFQVNSNLELPDDLVENLQQATEAMSAVKEEIADLKSDTDQHQQQ